MDSARQPHYELSVWRSDGETRVARAPREWHPWMGATASDYGRLPWPTTASYWVCELVHSAAVGAPGILARPAEPQGASGTLRYATEWVCAVLGHHWARLYPDEH